MTMKPLTPADVKAKPIMDDVIEAFNDLLLKRYSGGQAVIGQGEVVSAVVAKIMARDVYGVIGPRAIRSKLFEDHQLDVEDVYREAGWDVTYDAPGYNESGEATWVFRSQKK